MVHHYFLCHFSAVFRAYLLVKLSDKTAKLCSPLSNFSNSSSQGCKFRFQNVQCLVIISIAAVALYKKHKIYVVRLLWSPVLFVMWRSRVSHTFKWLLYWLWRTDIDFIIHWVNEGITVPHKVHKSQFYLIQELLIA